MGDRAPPGRGARQRHRGRRRRPEHLPLPRRGAREHPRLPRRVSGAASVVLVDNYRSRQPILDAAHRLIRHNDPDRLEAREGLDKRLRAARGSTAPSRRPGAIELPGFTTGSDEADAFADRIGASIRAGRRRGPRHPGARQPRRRSLPARAEHGAHPVALQRHGRPVPAARGAGAHQLPARGERPGRLGQPLRPGHQRDLRTGPGRRHPGAEPCAPPTQQPRGRPATRRPSTRGFAVQAAGDRGRAAAARQPRGASGHEHREDERRAALPLHLLHRLARSAGARGARDRRGAARQRGTLLRDRAAAGEPAARRPAAVPGRAARHAHRDRRRPVHRGRRAGRRGRRGARPDLSQGQGPRVRRRVPGRPGRRSLPGPRPARRARAARRARSRRAHRSTATSTSARSGACSTSA